MADRKVNRIIICFFNRQNHLRSKMDEAKKVLSTASKRNGRGVEPEQIELVKPSTAAAKGGFLDIMKHSTLRIQVLIMYFNWFTTAFIMYGLALS